jgi:hypothetical protein
VLQIAKHVKIANTVSIVQKMAIVVGFAVEVELLNY